MSQANTPSPALRRVPVRSLAARHRERILAHLLALDPRDRYLRFGHAASDGQIARYVDQIDFERDEVFGIFNRRLTLVAMAHLATLGDADANGPRNTTSAAEFGVSVARHARGRGWGARLFDRAVLHARNRHVDTLIIHALSENSAMLHIARAAGAKVQNDGPDAMARLKLPPDNFASQMEELVEQQVAEFDYGLKVQAHRLDAWLHRISDAPAHNTAPDPRVPAGDVHMQARDHGQAPPV